MPHKGVDQVRIAICDDEKQERQLIIDWLQQENISKFDIYEYGSADDLLRAIQGGRNFNLIYLDIEMPGDHNGLEAARILAQEHDPAMLVFITSYREFINQGYKVSAMDFLTKPLNEEEFRETFQRCRQKYDAQHYLLFEKRDDVLQIMASDILVVTARRNYVEITYRGGEEPFEYRSTMAEMERLLSDKGFFRCHNSYIINLAYLKRVYRDKEKQCWAMVSDGEQDYKLSVSQNKWTAIRRALHEFRRGRM